MISLGQLQEYLKQNRNFFAYKEFNRLLVNAHSLGLEILSEFLDLTHRLVGNFLIVQTSSIHIDAIGAQNTRNIYFELMEKQNFLLLQNVDDKLALLQINFFFNAGKNFLKVWDFEEALGWLGNGYYFCQRRLAMLNQSEIPDLQQIRINIIRLINFAVNLAVVQTQFKTDKSRLLNEYFKNALSNEFCDLEKLFLEFKSYVGIFYELEQTNIFEVIIHHFKPRINDDVLQDIEKQFAAKKNESLGTSFYLDNCKLNWQGAVNAILTARSNLHQNSITITSYKAAVFTSIQLLYQDILKLLSTEANYAHCLVALGSLRCSGFSPFSDADVAIWLEDEQQKTQTYLSHFVNLLQICLNLSSSYSKRPGIDDLHVQGHSLDQSFGKLWQGILGWHLLDTPENMATWAVKTVVDKENSNFNAARALLRPRVVQLQTGKSTNKDRNDLFKRFNIKLFELLGNNQKHKEVAKVCHEHAQHVYFTARKSNTDGSFEKRVGKARKSSDNNNIKNNHSVQQPEALLDAIRNDNIDTIKALLKHIDVNVRHPQTQITALHQAAIHSHNDVVQEVIKILLDAGADSELRWNGETPSECARANDRPDVAKWIEETELNRTKKKDQTVLNKPVKILNRKGLANLSSNQLIALLKLSDETIVGTAVDDGGCGFDALAQCLGGNHTEKSLRLACHKYYLNLPGEDNKKEVDDWIKKLGTNNPNVGNASYLLVQYTGEELKEPTFSIKGNPTWFMQEIDGRVLCCAMLEVLPNGIHVIEITLHPESVGHYVITKEAYSQIEDEDKIKTLYALPTLIVSNRHFVSVLSKEKAPRMQNYPFEIQKKHTDSYIDIKKEYTSALIAWCLDFSLYFFIVDKDNACLEGDIEKILDDSKFPLSSFLKRILKEAWNFVYKLRIDKQFARPGGDTDFGEYVIPKGSRPKGEIKLLIGQTVPEIDIDETFRLKLITQFIIDPIYTYTLTWLNEYKLGRQFDFLSFTITKSCEATKQNTEVYLLDLVKFLILYRANPEEIYHYYSKIPTQYKSYFLYNLETELQKLNDPQISKPIFLVIAKSEIARLINYFDRENNEFNNKIEATCKYVIDISINCNISKNFLMNLYQKFSTRNELEILRNYFIDKLIEKNMQALLKEVENIPNPFGYKQSERLAYQKLSNDLLALSNKKNKTGQEPKVTMTWPDIEGKIHTIELDPAVINSIIDKETGQIKHMYENSLHDVASLDYGEIHLHFKGKPYQAIMDFAIDLLYRRLATTKGTPANVLAVFTVIINNNPISYPVLVSTTVGKKTLCEALKNNPNIELNSSNYTEHVLISGNTRPGDNLSKNYALNTNHEDEISIVDNEHKFVEPLIKIKNLIELATNKLKLNQVKWSEVLFCLKQADKPLNKATIETFFKGKNFYQILKQWSQDVKQREDLYLQVCSERIDRQALGSLPNPVFIEMLLPKGAFGGMLFNLNYLQQHFLSLLANEKQMPTALEYQKILYPGVNHYYTTAYKSEVHPEKRMAAVIEVNHTSVPSSIAIESTLGFVPTFEEVAKRTQNTLKQAIQELEFFKDDSSDFTKRNFSVFYDSAGMPDIYLHSAILAVHFNRAFEELPLSHCAILDDNQLETILKQSKQLKRLDLRSCPKLTFRTITYLLKNHAATLEEIYLSNNNWLKIFTGNWPKLKLLHVNNCSNFESITIEAPHLLNYEDNNCQKLKEKKVKTKHILSAVLPEKFRLTEKKLEFDVLAISLDISSDKAVSEYCDMIIPLRASKKKFIYNNQQFHVSMEMLLNGKEYLNDLQRYANKFIAILIFVPLGQNVNFKENLEEFLEKIIQYKITATLIVIGLERHLCADDIKTELYEQRITVANKNVISAYLESYDQSDRNEIFEVAYSLAIEKSGFWQRFTIPYKSQPAFVTRKAKLPILAESAEEKQKLKKKSSSVSDLKPSHLSAVARPSEDSEIFYTVTAISLSNDRDDYVSYFCENRSYRDGPPILKFMYKKLELFDKKFKIIFEIPAAQERSLILPPTHKRDAFFIFAPLENSNLFYNTLNNCHKIISKYKRPIILIGINRNKSYQYPQDLVTFKEAQEAAKKMDLQAYFEANDSQDARDVIQEALMSVLKPIYSKKLNYEEDSKETRVTITKEEYLRKRKNSNTFSAVFEKLIGTTESNSPYERDERQDEIEIKYTDILLPIGFRLSDQSSFKNISLSIMAIGTKEHLDNCIAAYKNTGSSSDIGKLNLHGYEFKFTFLERDALLRLRNFPATIAGVLIILPMYSRLEKLVEEIRISKFNVPIVVLRLVQEATHYLRNEIQTECRALSVKGYFECYDYHPPYVYNIKEPVEGAVELIIAESGFWKSIGESFDLSECARAGLEFKKQSKEDKDSKPDNDDNNRSFFTR